MTPFLRLLHAEWTKFRTVAGWVTAMGAAALMVVLVALLAGVTSNQQGAPPVPVGPGGEPVTDSFYFVHHALNGDGTITVAVAALTTSIPTGPGDLRPGTVPWAKAGIVIKQSTRPGSPYAAIMVTAGHGVRMQDNYVHDRATAPARWLRLDRSGDTITGSTSADGTQWTKVGTVRVELGANPLGGLFVASPPHVNPHGLGTRGSVSTATFEDLRLQGRWTGEQVGAESPTFAGYPERSQGSFARSGDSVTVTGAGDIAPAVRETLPTGGTHRDLLTGAFAALITVIVVAALSITTEYRTALIRLTLAAAPGRGQVLAAKAIVLGCVTFVTGLVGTAVAAPFGERTARANGIYIFPVTTPTALRLALGTAALLATAAILALAAGVIFRSSAAAVTTVMVTIVLPYLLVANPFLPATVATWLTRVTPAAAFSIQQTLVRYPQVNSIYTPYDGYYPLAPWAGLAVLAGYALVSLAIAAAVLHRRDA